MARSLVLMLLTTAAPALGGCVPMMAASALSMAARSAQSPPVSNEQLQPQAREACSAHAAQYGTVHVIDVQQASFSKIIVWGTVDDGKERRSFQCDFGTKISGFKLRPITPPR
jgi:ABC-type sugar transport system substrate-binding protein